MVTKYGKVQIVEKRELERLIKCERERKRQHIFDRLDKKRQAIEAPFNVKIEKLEKEREEAVKSAGYGKLRERGCYDTHPELDAFDAETNAELKKLWSE